MTKNCYRGELTAKQSFDVFSDFLAMVYELDGIQFSDLTSWLSSPRLEHSRRGRILETWCQSVDRIKRGDSPRTGVTKYTTTRAESTSSFMRGYDFCSGPDVMEDEAFRAVGIFVSQFEKRAGQDLDTLVFDTELEPDGGPIDPAAWDDWLEAVKAVQSARGPHDVHRSP